MSRMFNPPHTGDILNEEVLPELAISVTDAARQLGSFRLELTQRALK